MRDPRIIVQNSDPRFVQQNRRMVRIRTLHITYTCTYSARNVYRHTIIIRRLRVKIVVTMIPENSSIGVSLFTKCTSLYII